MTRALVLGIGNILWADEGFGPRAAEAFAARFAPHPQVEVLDGGTQGLYLLPQIEAADVLVIFDAVDYAQRPGALVVVHDADVPAFMGVRKMSLHQTGFQEVIATAQLLGRCPRRMVLIGVQPEELEDYGGGLRPVVAARLDEAVTLAAEALAEAGIALLPAGTADTARPTGPDADRAILSREAYEGGRPSAAAACRIGDPRFLRRAG